MKDVREKVELTLELFNKSKTDDFFFWENSGYASVDPNSNEVYFLLSNTTFEQQVEAEDAAIFANHSTQNIVKYAQALLVALDVLDKYKNSVFQINGELIAVGSKANEALEKINQIILGEK